MDKNLENKDSEIFAKMFWAYDYDINNPYAAPIDARKFLDELGVLNPSRIPDVWVDTMKEHETVYFSIEDALKMALLVATFDVPGLDKKKAKRIAKDLKKMLKMRVKIDKKRSKSNAKPNKKN